MGYNRWKGQIYDHFGSITELSIYPTVTEGETPNDWLDLIFAGDAPITLEYNYSQAMFTPIINLGVTVNLIAQFDNQYTEFGYSVQEKQYRATITRDGDVIFEGFVVNELYEEPHTFVDNYPVQINLVDGLNLLERTIRGSIGNTTGLWSPNEKRTLQDVLFEMLSDTQLQLDLEVQSALYPKQAIDDGLTTESPFLYEAVEPQVWQNDNGYQDDKKILLDKMISHGCSIFQHKGRWKMLRQPDINRLAEDYTNPQVDSYVYSFESLYQTKIQTISSNDVLFVNQWLNEDCTKGIEKGIEAQNVELDWVQRPNFVLNGDFEDGFRGFTHDYPEAVIAQAPSWEFKDPSDDTKKVKASDYVSNNVLTWTSIVYDGDQNPLVRYELTIPPTTSTTKVNFGFNYALNDLYTGALRSSALVFSVRIKDTSQYLAITNAEDQGIFKLPDISENIYGLQVSNENPFASGNAFKNSLAGKLEAVLQFPESAKTAYTTIEITFNGLIYFPFQQTDRFMSIDKVYANVSILGANNNQVETFYGGIDKQPFRKKGDDVKVSIGAPSNELHLSTLYYPLGSTTLIDPSSFNQETYQTKNDYMYTYSTDHDIDYDLIVGTPKILPSNTTANFTGYVNTDFDELGSDNLIEAEFKVNDVYLMINNTIKVQCYAKFNHFWGRRGAGFDITSDDVEMSGITITSVRIFINIKAGVHSGGGNCIFISNAYTNASFRQSGFSPITDYRNLSEIENRDGKDNQLCVRLLQSILTTRAESVWTLKGTLLEDIIITPNLTIFDKYLKDDQGNSRYMRPSSISTDLREMQHSVELIEVVNDVVVEGESNG